MVRLVEFAQTGTADVLHLVTRDLPPPAAGEVRIRHRAIGVNFVDIYHRNGHHAVPSLPAVPGVEAAGIVEETGEGVSGFAAGDRVAWAGLPAGGYATHRNIAAARLLRVPDGIEDRVAAAALLRGITAHMILHRVTSLQPGATVLVHAAAGGLGLTLVQWAKRLGATVIGTVSTPAKAQLAMDCGLDHAIIGRDTDFVAETLRLTGGKGVYIAIDGIGGDTLARTLGAVKKFGLAVSTGEAAGPVPPLSLNDIGPRRSISLARPGVLGAYIPDPASCSAAADAVFAAIRNGIKVTIGAEFPLEEAAAAHRALESGQTTGSVILIP